VRLAVRERLQQDPVDDGEDSCCCADGQGERADNGESEDAVAPKPPEGVADIKQPGTHNALDGPLRPLVDPATTDQDQKLKRTEDEGPVRIQVLDLRPLFYSALGYEVESRTTQRFSITDERDDARRAFSFIELSCNLDRITMEGTKRSVLGFRRFGPQYFRRRHSRTFVPSGRHVEAVVCLARWETVSDAPERRRRDCRRKGNRARWGAGRG
jgi:hypothetical protein